jgi:hypothetical protein
MSPAPAEIAGRTKMGAARQIQYMCSTASVSGLGGHVNRPCGGPYGVPNQSATPPCWEQAAALSAL